MRKSWAIVFLLLAAPFVGAAATSAIVPAAESAADASGAHAHDNAAVHSEQVPPNDRARGRVFDGLSPGKAGTLCEGLYEIMATQGPKGCTHGPDDAPAEASVAAAVAPATAQAIASATPIVCPPGDDGKAGLRVQAMYVYEQGKSNRYSAFQTSFPAYAGNVEATYAMSAAQTGGTRHVRWVTDTQCQLDVRVAAVPAGSLATFAAMRSALQGMGYNSVDRKYLVWADANVYCGLATMYKDDSPQGDGTVNANDGKYSMVARVDSGCWGMQNSVEAHELMHSLGGVQATAPHATTKGHCADNADRMCYNDGGLKSGQVMLTVCASTNERLFDCKHDDYYHTNPPAGTYLATHWNAASSRFLFSTAAAPTPTPLPPPPVSPPPPPPPSPAPTTFAATFAPRAVGNDWWIETAVTSSTTITKVEAKIGTGAWTALPATSWGTWAKSLNAPNGSVVVFRATSSAGATATSGAYTWT